jgi:hypothetical protein
MTSEESRKREEFYEHAEFRPKRGGRRTKEGSWSVVNGIGLMQEVLLSC